PGSLILIAAGIALIYVGGFGWNYPWIFVTFALTIVLAINGPLTNGRRSNAIHAMALNAGEGPVTSEIVRARCDRFTNYSIFLSLCELIAALFMMTTKPGLIVCIAAVAIAALVPLIPAARFASSVESKTSAAMSSG
ncbi:MAG: hypothetical protein JOZ01_03310, partial [Candidatus Eremiobacteraeota bacterium]|nr:hypothetical protein [Candidatus Eremiobacteraeota bacterium]